MANPSATPVTAVTERLRAAIAAQGLPDLLGELVSIESHATQPEGVAAVARVVERELAPAGFSWERRRGAPMAEAWFADLMLPGEDYERVADVVVGRRPGGPGHALLLADLDTSYEAGATVRFPLRIDGGRAIGPGVADMKGGLVVLVAALRALRELPGPAITVVLSPDEQAGSLASRAIIEAEAATADWCLCVECARDGGSLMGSRAHIADVVAFVASPRAAYLTGAIIPVDGGLTLVR